MKLERFKQILEAYGTDSQRWPGEERQAAQDFLSGAQEASLMMNEYQALDEILDALETPDINQIEDKVLQHVLSRSSWLDALVDWILPPLGEVKRHLWQPLMAASLVFVLGIFIGVSIDTDSYNITLMWEDDVYWFASNIDFP